MQTKNILRIALYFFVFITAWALLAWFLANNLIIEKRLQKAEAIFVLSGSAAYVERTHEAAAVFKQGIAPKIFLTNDGLQGGWNQKEERNPFFAERERWELIEQGVPQEAIEILPTIVAGTNDEANLLVKISRERQIKSLLLVTSAYHTRRALWTFERAACKNESLIEMGIVSPPAGLQTPLPISWWLTVQGWQIVGGEYVKLIYYWLI